MALNVRKVRGLKKPGRYWDGDGLYLQVMSGSNRSWLLRYQRQGRERWMGLGSAELFSLAEARDEAREARRQLARGIDPLDARRAKRAVQAAEAARSKTFADVTADYFNAHEASWSAKHRRDFLGSLRDHAHPKLGALPIASIDEALVLATLQPIWRDKTPTARRVRQRIESIMDFAAAAGYRSGDNPARWSGHLQHLLAAPDKLATVKHHDALPYAELPGFMSELRGVRGIAARALEFCILTAARSNEVIGARWEEIDLKASAWIIPAERMKARREHRVPLSAQAIRLLRALPREGDFVFMGVKAGQPIGTNAMSVQLKALRNNGVTVHGFRSCFRTWAEERTSFAPVLAEQALAHTIGSKVERSYRRTDLYDKRAKLMQAWSDYCDTPAVANNVTPLRASA